MICHASLPTAWPRTSSKLDGSRLDPQELVVMSAVCFHGPWEWPYTFTESLGFAVDCLSVGCISQTCRLRHRSDLELAKTVCTGILLWLISAFSR